MYTKSIILAAVAAFGLSACLETDLERGAVGGAAGAVIGNQVGIDPVAAGAAGVAAGLLCDDVGVCRPARARR
ncbi:MAG: hypothetical protein II336_07185 [Loktanella sp.]|nr:hypothetical protein [Loktanella sp.]